MKKTRIIKLVLILATVFVVMACNLPFGIGQKADKDDIKGNEVTEEAAVPVVGQKEEVDPNPIGIQAGLNSMDYYRVNIIMSTHDSTGAKSETNMVVDRSVLDKNYHSVQTDTSFDPENDTEESTSISETYSIGTATCSGSGEEWEYEEVSAQSKELSDVFQGMVDFLPVIDNPEFVGEENINGIDCNHFTFKVAGIGDTSGSVATVNSGEYWLAKDGQYMVKYHLILEVQSAAEGSSEAEISNIDASFDLTNVNVPITFTMPVQCVPQVEE